MMNGENTVVIIYDVVQSSKPFTLELLPLMAAKGYHSLTHEGPQMHWDANLKMAFFTTSPTERTMSLSACPAPAYHHDQGGSTIFNTVVEQYRGLDYTEDLFNHGIFTVELKQGDSFGIIISTEDPAGRNAHELLSKETMRRKLLISNQPDDETVQQLVLAADQFIVKRNIVTMESSEASSFGGGLEETDDTIIAGYHWFTDWGRDTMISLPGLCLSTCRYDDAKKILSAFAHSVSQGNAAQSFPG